ncbi:MAG: hypothetical protein IPI69_08675 [Bacteroidales bacterium]|nr:hypothetical protein [Bacteroidales bacterium]
MNRLAESIEKFKWLIIIAVIGLTVFFSYEAKDLHINSDIISSLPDDDPAARLYKEIGHTVWRKRYGNDCSGNR